MGLQNPDELSDTLSTLMLAEMEYRPIYPDHGIIHHKEGVDLLPEILSCPALNSACLIP